jgi:hypothetical protein
LAKNLKLTPAMKPRLMTKKLMELSLTLKILKKMRKKMKTVKAREGHIARTVDSG